VISPGQDLYVHSLFRERQQTVVPFCEGLTNYLESFPSFVSKRPHSEHSSTDFGPSNATNTIHVDDLVGFFFDLCPLVPIDVPQSRNFALNPREGLKIAAFKNAHTPEGMADRELEKLSLYLIHIAQRSDFTALTHKVCLQRTSQSFFYMFFGHRIGSMSSSNSGLHSNIHYHG